jgi:hypothetical protein
VQRLILIWYSGMVLLSDPAIRGSVQMAILMTFEVESSSNGEDTRKLPLPLGIGYGDGSYLYS